MTVTLKNSSQDPVISKYLYGQFSEHLGHGIYDGIYVGSNSSIPNVNGMRSDVVDALKKLHIPVLRWPGGLFADTYHWRDGIGPFYQRKELVNTNWGNVTENNHFGTHEYFELLHQLGAEAYINANVGSGTVQEMSEWVEYITKAGKSPVSDLRQQNGRQEPWPLHFFGIGNESWGSGGHMRPSYYADVYRQYQTFMPQYDPDHPIYKVACGPSDDDYNWTDTVMEIAGDFIDGISLHHYALPTGHWHEKGPAVGFAEEQWWSTIAQAQKMDELITKHLAIMSKHDPEHKVDLVVDEWGTWYDVEPGTNPHFLHQQNTIRDALVASITLDIFHKHADRISMENIAQTVNVLQAMILTKGDQMIKTPTYYVFDMYQAHMGAKHLTSSGEVPEHVSYSASQKDDVITISCSNYDLKETKSLSFDLPNHENRLLKATILTASTMDEHNTFEEPDRIVEQTFTGATLEGHRLTLELPPMSVVTLSLS